jgi:hypothetical protein
MSEVLKDVAEPWFRRTGSEVSLESARTVYEIVGVIWNLSRLRHEDGAEARLAEICSIICGMLPSADGRDVDELVREIHRRAIERHPNEDRTVVRTEVSQPEPGAFRLLVVSARAGE